MNIHAIIYKQLNDDVELESGTTIKTIVFQEMLFEGFVECRVFASNGNVYAALYENDDKITKFVFVPKQPEAK